MAETEAGISGISGISIILQKLAETDGLKIGEREAVLFETYARLLKTWNDRINLTSILDDREIAVKHFQDSLAILPRIRLYLPENRRKEADDEDKEGKLKPLRVADVGTGAGFPGIPIKILWPEVIILTLIDALEKRIAFLKEVVHVLGLEKETLLLHMRAEEAGRDPRLRDRMDLVLARAVAPMPVLAEYCLPLVRDGGLFVAMKGPDPAAEAETARNAIHRLGGRLERVELYTIGGMAGQSHETHGRSLVIIRKTGPTPAAYPRRAGTPARKPLL